MTLTSRLVAAALGLAVLAGPALAEFPERNIESIYPWAPGATMAASQVIADAMGDELGVNISVVSTPGAGACLEAPQARRRLVQRNAFDVSQQSYESGLGVREHLRQPLPLFQAKRMQKRATPSRSLDQRGQVLGKVRDGLPGLLPGFRIVGARTTGHT